jgi:hypothetical protein
MGGVWKPTPKKRPSVGAWAGSGDPRPTNPARQRASMHAPRSSRSLEFALLAYDLQYLLFKKNMTKSKKFLMERGSR